jgi:hypothetical protein
MAYEFKKLSEVDALTEVPEGANALIEINGDIKRVPGSGLGGATGIKTAIIKDSGYDSAISGMQTMGAAAPSLTYECINMTFEEAYETMANGEPLSVFGMLTGEGAMNMYGVLGFTGTAAFGVPCILVFFEMANIMLYWTANGLLTEAPSSGK